MSDIAGPVGAETRRRRGPLADFFYRLVREKPLGLLGAVTIVLFVLVSIFADVLAPDPEQRQDVTRRLQGSSAEHLLGTDHTGRDFLSRNIYGARLSLLVGFAATTVAVLVATVVGGLSGFVGGRLDLLTQRFVDAWMAFPGLLLLMTIMSILGTGAPQIIIVLGLTYGVGSSRVIRGAVIGVKENAYFEAAQAVGSPAWRTVLRHVLPNVLAPIIVIFSITIGAVIITEASLSFLDPACAAAPAASPPPAAGRRNELPGLPTRRDHVQSLLATDHGFMVNPGVGRGEVDAFADRQSEEVYVGKLLRGSARQRTEDRRVGQRHGIGDELVRAQIEQMAQFYQRLGR